MNQADKNSLLRDKSAIIPSGFRVGGSAGAPNNILCPHPAAPVAILRQSPGTCLQTSGIDVKMASCK
jgi:hypothetical protein